MYKSCNVKDANRLLEKINDIPSTKTLLIQDKQNISNNETPLYTTIQKDKTIDVDKRLQDCGGIIDPLQDNVDNKQEGLIMSIPQLAWVWRNVAKKDKKLQDEAVCYYKTFIGYCKMNDIELSSKDQCNIPADWDPDNNNICQDTVDANKAVQDAMNRASQQESDFNKQVAQEQAAAATYQDNLKDHQDRKAKHDAAKNKPPTSDEVYAYINEASTGKNHGPVPGVEAPGPEPTDPNELDSTSTLVPVDENPDSKELDSTSTLVPLNSQALPVAIDSGSVPYEVPLIDPNNIESVTVDSSEEATNKTVKEWIALADREGFFTGALKDDFEAFPSEEGESEEAKKIRFAKRQLNQYFAPPSSSSCSVPKPKTYKVNNRQVPEGYSYNKSSGDGNCLYYSVLSASHAKKCSPGNDSEFKTLIDQNNLKEAMTILRVKLLQFMDSDEYKRCPNYATANKDSSEALVLNNYISMKSSIGTLDNWAGDEVLGLIECMCNITIRVFYKDCWGRNNQGDDSDPNLINLYFTGNHYDWLSKNDQATSGGKSNNPIVEATLTAMSQFGGGDGSSVDLDVFSKCTAKKCKNFYSLCRTREEFQKYWHDFGGLSDEEISRLGGLEEDNQEGLVVSLPQLDKVYNNTALTSTKSDKACLRCLYMGFINLCKARGIALDPELQQDITKDYKPGDIKYSIESNNVTPTPSSDSTDGNSDDGNTHDGNSDDGNSNDGNSDDGNSDDGNDDDNSDDGDEDDILRSASGTSSISKKKVPRGPKNNDLPVAKPTGVNPPIQIITDTRKKDKYIWIKIKADPNCLSGVIDNTYDSAEATLNKLINIDDDEAVNFAQAVTPSAPPPDDGSGTTKPSTSRSNSDGSGIIKPSAPPADSDSGTTQSISKPSSGFTSDEPASNLVSPDEDKSKSITGGCNDIPEETEERPPPASGKAKKGELFCPSQAPYLCGKKTISYQDRLKRGLGAACRVKEHDCNSRKLPVGDTDSAKKVYQSVNEEDGLSARFYVDPSKNPADITSCSKKTKGGSKKHKKSSKNRKSVKKLSLKIRT